MNRYHHEGATNRTTGIKLVLPDDRPARRARLTAAEVLDLFGQGGPASVESQPFSARLLRPSTEY